MRSLYALALAAVLVLPGCDSAEPIPDLFLIPEINQRNDFYAPDDSTVQLPTRTFEFVFNVTAPAATGASVVVGSPDFIDFGAYVRSQGFEPTDVLSIEPTSPISLTIESGGADLSFISSASVTLVSGARRELFASRSGTSGFLTNTAVLNPLETLSPSDALGASGAELSIVTRRATTEPYRLRLSVPVRIAVDASSSESPIEVTGRDLDVRDILLDNDFDIGDVQRARYVSVQIDPVQESAFESRVERVTIQATTTSGEGAPVTLARVTQFGEPLTIDADVASIIRRTGRIRLTASLELEDGATANAGQLSFTLLSKLRVEVPQPSTVGS